MYIYVYIYICIYICIYIYMYIYICIYICIYIYVYIYTRVVIYTYTWYFHTHHTSMYTCIHITHLELWDAPDFGKAEWEQGRGSECRDGEKPAGCNGMPWVWLKMAYVTWTNSNPNGENDDSDTPTWKASLMRKWFSNQTKQSLLV